MLPGVVVSVQGPAIGPASAISYTVDVTYPDRVRRIRGLTPKTGRYPDTIDVRAHAPTAGVWVCDVADNLALVSAELPDIAPCPGGG